MKGYVNNIIAFSSVDGIGNRMSIFFQGCNFRCLYCHNPETIPFVKDETTFVGYKMTPEEILKKAKEKMPFIRGVTISGGECTSSFEFLLQTVKLLKENSISVLIDTNGSLETERIIELSKYIDGFMLDIKAISPKEHKKLTGADNKKVIDAFYTMAKLNKLYEVRTVVLSGEYDSKGTVDKVSKMIERTNPNIAYKIIKFRNHGTSKMGENLIPPTDTDMSEFGKIAYDNGVKKVIIV